ncbi:hypothetical protein Hamer_G001109 [Homarus americanus]|uniref:Uncharacterized protein n=1 Tax=Homarus americanus TaxID=6706 RepID=A0A8J5T2J5_HOMAM|nr:hypothetical protein Hamer_G001109 [Homarus americanus]
MHTFEGCPILHSSVSSRARGKIKIMEHEVWTSKPSAVMNSEMAKVYSIDGSSPVAPARPICQFKLSIVCQKGCPCPLVHFGENVQAGCGCGKGLLTGLLLVWSDRVFTDTKMKRSAVHGVD